MSSSKVLVREAPKTQKSSNKTKTGVRAYVLLTIVDVKSELVAQALRDMPGVVIADPLEGITNLLIMVEASDRLELAELLMPAIAAADGVTEDIRLLITPDSSFPIAGSSP